MAVEPSRCEQWQSMVRFSFGVPDSSAKSNEDGSPEKPRKRIPLAAIPVTLAVGLLVAAGYVGNRILASRPQATAIVGNTFAHPQTESAVPTTPHLAESPKPSPLTPAATPVSSTAQTRIVRSNAAEVQKVEAALVKLADPDVGTAEKADHADNVDLIAPEHGKRYLQIAAISARASERFLAQVSRYNVQASIAPGPSEGVVRVVIGPFSDRESLAAAKEQIRLNWPDCFVRVY